MGLGREDGDDAGHDGKLRRSRGLPPSKNARFGSGAAVSRAQADNCARAMLHIDSITADT